MAQQDLIALHIPETDLVEIRAAIGVLKAKLLPQLHTLRAQERIALSKSGDETVAFVQKSLEHAKPCKIVLRLPVAKAYQGF